MSQKTQSSSKLMKSLSSGYAQQKHVSGADIHAMVAMMGDIISITDSNSSDSSGLNEMAQVCSISSQPCIFKVDSLLPPLSVKLKLLIKKYF